MIVTYRHRRPKAKRPTPPVKITGSPIVTARKPTKYMMKTGERPPDPAGDKRVRPVLHADGTDRA